MLYLTLATLVAALISLLCFSEPIEYTFLGKVPKSGQYPIFWNLLMLTQSLHLP